MAIFSRKHILNGSTSELFSTLGLALLFTAVSIFAAALIAAPAITAVTYWVCGAAFAAGIGCLFADNKIKYRDECERKEEEKQAPSVSRAIAGPSPDLAPSIDEAPGKSFVAALNAERAMPATSKAL
jgi:hypothetical protein